MKQKKVKTSKPKTSKAKRVYSWGDFEPAPSWMEDSLNEAANCLFIDSDVVSKSVVVLLTIVPKKRGLFEQKQGIKTR